MVEDFDIGPLTWVNDEINQALNSVLDSLAKVAANPEDVGLLRFAETHLYQVSGALDMVGLEGCKRFCAEIESITAKLEKKSIAVTPETLETITRAVKTMIRYLQDLLDGLPDTPLKLFPELDAMGLIQGESFEESELFFPDTSVSAPKEISALSRIQDNPSLYIAEQRAQFQKSLLSWFKNASVEAISGIRATFENLQKAQQQSSQIALWWAATAFADSIGQRGVAEHAHVKRLLRRIDQQLKSMTEGTARGAGSLLRDILYYVAISESTTDLIAQVKSHFELDRLIPNENQKSVTGVEVTEAEALALNRLREAIPAMEEIWTAVSEDKPDSLDNFLLKLSENLDSSEMLVHDEIRNLFSGIHQLSTALDLDSGKKTEPAVIEVATAITLLDDALKAYPRLDAETRQRLVDESRRLHEMTEGSAAAIPEMIMSDHLDKGVVAAVAEQIKSALKTVEQVLDTFFRNPTERQLPATADKPLQQIVSAFDVLDMPLPSATAKACATLVDYFGVNYSGNRDGLADQDLFELVAENLSLLDMVVDQLPRRNTEYDAALEAGLARLQDRVQQLGKAKAELAGTETPVAAADEAADAGVQVSGMVSEHALDSELLDIYLSEVEEVLGNIAQNLQTLRVNATDHEALVEVRRGFHTLKGSGRTVGLLALGEVAWAVEKLLNLVMERKQAPSSAQLNFIEQASAAFAGWADKLSEAGVVALDSHEWQREAEALENEAAVSDVAPVSEEVLIGGTRKLSRALFNIFMSEAEQHLRTLVQEAAEFSVEKRSKPSDAVRRAAHTLASNAGAAGFKPIEELARALEHWLDAHQGHWTEQSLSLIGNVISALSNMLQKAGQLRQPRRQSGLLAALKEATLLAPAAESVQSGVDEIALSETSELPAYAEAETAGEVRVKPEFGAAPESSAVMANEIPGEKAKAKPAQLSQVDEELLTMFVEEARELVPQIGKELRAWRTNPLESDHPDALQRALHTLKGSARTAGQAQLGDAVHQMEDRVVRALRHKGRTIDFDEMFLDLDRIGGLLEDALGLHVGARGKGVDNALDVAEPVRAVNRRAQYLRLRADALDRLINEAGEISIARSRMYREMQNFKQFSLDLTESVFRLRNHLREMEIEAESQMQSRMTLLQEANEVFDPLEFDRFTRLQELTRMMAESVNDVATIQHSLLMNLDETESALQQQNRMNRELQHGLMNVRMVPFALISERLQRIVRQTARELDKRVNLVIEGEAVSVDRSVLEKIGAPLEHLLRNSVAHGIETAAQRKKSGKPEIGNITLKVRQESDEIILTVTDDGAGIDVLRVREKAIEKGFFAADQEVGEQALLSVIFEPGFSTATEVSQIAGRGVGLDSVRSDITSLGGRIDVNHSAGHGATFSIYLPASLVVAQVVLVRAGSSTFALPSVMVEQVQKVKPSVLAEAYAAGVVNWADRQYPLHFMSRLIGEVDSAPESQIYTPVILLRSGTYRIALHVDEIVSNQEVVMKAIGPQLARVPGIMGATVLGDGKIILVLNPVQLANREMLAIGSVKVSAAAPVKADDSKAVLVVDDSLTMRKVLGRLLEREGYRVITAKDGVDALQILQDVIPDIILSDIEMPRMDGFEFTRSVRGDSRTAGIPLIIISSRTAEKHRALAKELGANAYLGKPVQDDDLLLQISHFLDYAAPTLTS